MSVGLLLIGAVVYVLQFSSFDFRSKANFPVSDPLSFQLLHTNPLSEFTAPYVSVQGNQQGRVVATNEGAVFSAMDTGVSSLFMNFGSQNYPRTNIKISLEFKDDAIDSNGNGILEVNEPGVKKTSYVEVSGVQSNGQPVRFYVGINYDGGIQDETSNKDVFCIGNSIGDINNYQGKRECIRVAGINRVPRLNTWVPIEIYITEVGTYATIDGIPTFIFGRDKNSSSLNNQVAGIFTPLTSLGEGDSFVVTNKARFAQPCGQGQECGTGRWKNLKIERITLNGTQNTWLLATTQRYVQQYPNPFSEADFPSSDPTLRYRFVADDLAVRALRYKLGNFNEDKAYIETVIGRITPEAFGQGLAVDIGTSDPLKMTRGGQSVYSFGLAYALLKDTGISQATKDTLLNVTRVGVIKLRDDVKFANGVHPCPVRQNPTGVYDTRAEECIWKVKGLSVALLLPNFSTAEKKQIEDIIWESLNHAFSRENMPNRPQAPGWNIFADGKIANHSYKNNPTYAVCSVLGNLLDANVAVRLAQREGYALSGGRDFLRPDVTMDIWNASSPEVGLSNVGSIKYMNPNDFTFFPYTQIGGGAFTQKLPQRVGSGAVLDWQKGYDDWGTTARWCSSGILLAKQVAPTSNANFEQLVRLNAYLDYHTLTTPFGCTYTQGIAPSSPSYRCIYKVPSLQQVFRARGLDVKRAHRDMVSYLYLNPTILGGKMRK